jgi:hypothetical protein
MISRNATNQSGDILFSVTPAPLTASQQQQQSHYLPAFSTMSFLSFGKYKAQLAAGGFMHDHIRFE